MTKTKKILKLIEVLYVVSLEELCKILGEDKDKVSKLVSYLIKTGRVTRIRRGYYTLPKISKHINVIAPAILKPSYISLGYSLSIQNVITQYVPEVEVVTTRKFPESMRIIEFGGYRIHFYKWRKVLFFGYRWVRENNYYYPLAYPEKAILDLYSYGIDPDTMFTVKWEKINVEKLMEYSKMYPKRVKDYATKVTQNIFYDCT
ncbi:MAG: type IV toxin-antitoxin system AbiEi family antitoxin domain-containing protein [Candidatus Njordarchaeia archaeon]